MLVPSGYSTVLLYLFVGKWVSDMIEEVTHLLVAIY
jgi:hypothetical protein